MKEKKISVVIPCVNGLPFIQECLWSIYKQDNHDIAEVIVADSSNDTAREWIKKSFPDVILLQQKGRLSIPELKAKGIRKAKGEILVMLEDHCVVAENWYEEIIKAHDSKYIAIGGAVENGFTDTTLDWATFFCEYGSFIQPVPRGSVNELPGNNVSYKREEFLKIAGTAVDDGLWEGFIHAELRRKGNTLYSSPDITVIHKKRFGLFEFLEQRFYYSRSFAAMRNISFSKVKRLFYSVMSVALPPVLFFRIFKVLVRKRRLKKEVFFSMPYLFLFTIVWAFGEGWGYLFGAGQSLLKIK